MGKLEEIYKLRSEGTDSSMYFGIFKEYGEKCNHITEFGFGGGWAAVGFLITRPKKYIAYDLHLQGVWKEYREFLKPHTDFIGIQADTGNMPVIEETDLLWIDSSHNYPHLKKELTLHGNQARKWIMRHDTTLFRDGSHDGSKPGLMQAIEEFIETNPHWKIKYIAEPGNGPGLTILERT